MINLLKKYRAKNEGTAAIEFAILLPFLLIMFFGAFEISRYILVIRKVENATNDIGFLLSREGTIHDIDGDGSVSSTSEDAGRIERIAAAAIPFLMVPYETDNYEIEIRSVARPTDATNAPDDARLMWSHKVSNNEGAPRPAEVSPSDEFSITPSTSTVSGDTTPSSIYSDGFGQRAELTFEGQTFLLVNFAYGYDQIINNFVNYISLNLENSGIEKISTYAARSRWIDDGDGTIQANEFFNQLQICTECNTFTSDDLGGDAGSPCEDDNSTNPETSGCTFN